jgi:hypothetical protein
VAKFAVGQRVRALFNPPKPDLRVPDQVNGAAPGRGDYQTEPVMGEVLEVLSNGYLVEVELSITHDRGGRPHVVKSLRKRVIKEEKLQAA